MGLSLPLRLWLSLKLWYKTALNAWMLLLLRDYVTVYWKEVRSEMSQKRFVVDTFLKFSLLSLDILLFFLFWFKKNKIVDNRELFPGLTLCDIRRAKPFPTCCPNTLLSSLVPVGHHINSMKACPINMITHYFQPESQHNLQVQKCAIFYILPQCPISLACG